MGKENKELKDLNLLDKFLFDEAVAAPGFLEDVLSIIFEKDIELKYPPQSEREVRRGTRNREVRLDVWAEDIKGTIHDTEVQKEKIGNLPKRFRLYHALISSKLLPKGIKDLNKLNDVIVIIIAPFDLFKAKRYRYTFQMSCNEIPGLKLNDGITTIYLNTRGTVRDGVSDELIDLLHLFEETTEETARKSSSERIQKLLEQVERIRIDEEVGIRFMNRWEEEMEWLEEGRKEGRTEMLAALVHDSILTIEQAAACAEMTVEEFQAEVARLKCGADE